LQATGAVPAEVITDRAPTYPRVLDETWPVAWHHTERYANNRVEADHAQLKGRLRPMRGIKTLTVTFSLVIAAQLALADGDARRAAMALGAAEGRRRLAGLKAWPSTRRREAELVTRVAQVADSWDFEDALAAGAQLSHREAVARVRGSA
jgi:hypothetical protein